MTTQPNPAASSPLVAEAKILARQLSQAAWNAGYADGWESERRQDLTAKRQDDALLACLAAIDAIATPVHQAAEPAPMSQAAEPAPMSQAAEPAPMSQAAVDSDMVPLARLTITREGHGKNGARWDMLPGGYAAEPGVYDLVAAAPVTSQAVPVAASHPSPSEDNSPDDKADPERQKMERDAASWRLLMLALGVHKRVEMTYECMTAPRVFIPRYAYEVTVGPITSRNRATPDAALRSAFNDAAEGKKS